MRMKIHTIWVADHMVFSTNEHQHDYYQLIYCKNSGGLIKVNGVTYEPVPGQVFFVKPMAPHLMKRGKNMRVIEIKFLAEGEEADERLRLLPDAFYMKDGLSLRMSLKDVVKEGLSHSLYSNDSTNAAMELMLIRILREFIVAPGESLRTYEYKWLGEMRQGGQAAQRNGDIQFTRLVEYIEAHIAEPIGLDDLSSFMHFNKTYLVERFKSIWGVPPMKYVNWIRLEKAKELLTTTDKSITDIACETGFRSIHYFSRHFKEKEDMTPQSYRQRFAEALYKADAQV